MSGRTIFQQGMATTCKDSLTEAKAEGSERNLVWRMSPYERLWEGNTSLWDGERHTRKGSTLMGQRGSRHMAGILRTCGGTQSPRNTA